MSRKLIGAGAPGGTRTFSRPGSAALDGHWLLDIHDGEHWRLYRYDDLQEAHRDALVMDVVERML